MERDGVDTALTFFVGDERCEEGGWEEEWLALKFSAFCCISSLNFAVCSGEAFRNCSVTAWLEVVVRRSPTMAPSPMPCKKVPLMDKSSSPNETIPGDASGLGRRRDLYERVFELSVATRSITYFCKDDTRTLPLASIRIVPPNFELVVLEQRNTVRLHTL